MLGQSFTDHRTTRVVVGFPRASLAILLTGVVILCATTDPAAGAQPGSLDTDFTPGDGVDQSVFALSVQPDGKIIVGGDFTTVGGVSRNGIARLNSSGSLDSAFDPGSGPDDLVNTVALQGNKLIIGGYFTQVSGTAQGYMARLDSQGALDMSFDPGSGADGPVLALAVQGDGKVLLGGEFTTINGIARNNIARLNSNGSLDTDFDPGAGVSGALFSSVKSIAVQGDGKVIIGGAFTSVNGAARTNIAQLHTDGSVDNGFNPRVDVAGAGVLAGVNSLAVQSDGKIVIGGDFTGINGIARTNISRLNSNGSLDTTFNPGTLDFAVNSLAVQSNGKIVIGGFFTRVSGATRKYVARLNSDGSLDTDFDPGSGADDAVYVAALQEDGKVLIGGLFRSFDRAPRDGIARLHGDPVIPAMRLLSPVRSSNTFLVSVATLAGKSYALEFKDALADSVWTPLPAVMGDGQVKVLQDTAATGVTRFYRVRME
jgi:uncharacterized delta-60 repeat protein